MAFCLGVPGCGAGGGAIVVVRPPSPSPKAADAAADPSTNRSDAFPGIHIDRDQGLIDLEAIVANRQPEWLELLACKPGSREYESLFTVAALPSHVHLALLMLEVKSGSPLWAQMKDQNRVVHLPTGGKVSVSIIYQKNGTELKVGANQWILNRESGKFPKSDIWLFTGSKVIEHEGRKLYMADLNGTIISLVNFGDDLLARPTDRTDKTDDRMWRARTDQIPPVGTKLIIRLEPVTDRPQTADQ